MSFSIAENFRSIRWGPTLLLHLLRSLSAGVVWTVILFLGDLGKDAFAALYMVPLSYLIGVPILLGIFKLVVGLFRLVDLAGFADLAFALVSVMGALGIMVGDPILFLLQKVKPGLLPVEKFHFVNFCMIYFVTCE